MTQGQGEGMVKLHTMNLVAVALLIQTWDLFEYSAQNTVGYP